ncbi:MAG TPA: autotransporter assembly complex family protein [Accumulibacter sp.]|nr:autotransporter assembly complex family protein [Accumulibacter sp.]HMW16537.1 autotransporter assembly complex family protein [Accumulibacter sp.]HMX21359.1 autotransporter assembly complex family protein [Accumulibacter sp.]HNC18120.1 autotransporter assembly complex family protein [Accumulibacter sp.]HND78965.1 autotransporter assembly complex family protein [Accumulibacter sp.]
MPKKTALLVLLVLWAVHVDAVTLQAPDAIKELLTRQLTLDELADRDDLAQRVFERKIQTEIGEVLATEGYFSPKVSWERQENERQLTVDPGPRSSIGEVSIEIAGEIGEDRRRAIVAGWGLPSGQPFRQEAWDKAKQSLLGELLSREFADARLSFTRAEVDPSARRVDLRVRAETGPRYRFGELQISGQQRFPARLISKLNRQVRPGEVYSEDALFALQAALQSTAYFSSVSVTLDRDPGQLGTSADGSLIAPVKVLLRERQPYQLSFGGGYSSNTGARVEGSFRDIDLFGRAWELQSGMRIEQLRQTAFADIFLPPDGDPKRDGFGMAFENSSIAGLALRRWAIGATRVEQSGKIERRLGVNWQQEWQTPDGAPSTTNRALTAQIGWTWRDARDPLDPADGISLQLQLGGASKQLLSDQDFLRSYFRYSQGVSLGNKDTLLFRTEFGATFARSSRGIPQDFLFRAGGSNSVRGYAYQSLGVRQGAATLGGRYLTTLSGEYTHWLDANWGAAVFVDAGDAADDRQSLRLALGYGVGARWKSPAGPLGVDLAYGQRTGKFRLDFSVAVPF